VQVSREEGARHVPLADASVGAYYAGQNAWIAGAGTDVGGHAVLACIRSDTVVDVRVSSQGFFSADVAE